MNWLTEYVRPKMKGVFQSKDTPDHLWHKCNSCDQMIFHRDYEASLHVCDNCGHHMKISPADRFKSLFDGGEYTVIETPEAPADPLKFRDSKKYTDRLKEARSKTGARDTFLVAEGKIEAIGAVLAAHDFDFMAGSMGCTAGNALLAAADHAVVQGLPLIVFPSSGGARMQEGVFSLMQLPRTTIAVQTVREAGLPYIVVLTDPTTGGVTASYAMLGDIQLAEPRALIGFAGRRVIEQTIREQLPEGFQRAEYLLEHGMLDAVVRRQEMKAALGRILRVLLHRAPQEAALAPEPDSEAPQDETVQEAAAEEAIPEVEPTEIIPPEKSE